MSSNEGNSVIQGKKEYRDRHCNYEELQLEKRSLKLNGYGFPTFHLNLKKNQPYGIIRSVMFSLLNIKVFSWKSVETCRIMRL